MIDIKEEIIDGELRIYVGDRIYERQENPVGVRSKFWAVRRGGKLIYEPPKITDLLFKYNRNGVSSEDLGEVISSKLYKKCGLKVVTYYTANFTDLEGNAFSGVLCGSYKRNHGEIETSGYALQTVLTPIEFNKETGEVTNKSMNTVYGFMADLESLVEVGVPYRDDILGQIKNDLSKQALLDFLVAQADRHWTNTTFLEFINKDGFYAIRKSKCYDNGCIASLKRKKETISRHVSMMKGDYISSDIMATIMDKYIPMFGIKTSTCVIDTRIVDKYDRIDKIRSVPSEENKRAFISELADEIVNNQALGEFYEGVKSYIQYNKEDKSICLDEMFLELENSDEQVPKDIREMVAAVMTYQIDKIEKELEKKKGIVDSNDSEMGA